MNQRYRKLLVFPLFLSIFFVSQSLTKYQAFGANSAHKIYYHHTIYRIAQKLSESSSPFTTHYFACCSKAEFPPVLAMLLPLA